MQLQCFEKKIILVINTRKEIVYPNPLDRSTGNYSLADLHHQYKKYIHKSPKHILF